MLAIVSPAKTLDYESKLSTKKFSEPNFALESSRLIQRLRDFSPADLSGLMGISDNLAELNHRRYHEWQATSEHNGVCADRATSNSTSQAVHPTAARPAVLAFKGDVYIGLDAQTMSERDFTWAQKHLRILSGLYGLLRPMDRIQPYRLEMGTRLKTDQGANLYEFWNDKVTNALNEALEAQQPKQATGKPLLINLASNEYFNVVKPDLLNARIINIQFKELRDGEYRFLSFFAKKARGSMARYMIDHRVATLKSLRSFNYDGYAFNKDLSSGDNWVFTRLSPPLQK